MHTFTVTGTDKAGNVTTVDDHYTVVYTWNGYFTPVTNTETSTLNLVHAGDLIKLGFGLNGDRGLNVFAGGFPTSVVDRRARPGRRTSCPAARRRIDGRASATASPPGHYTYGWQTSAGWAGTCRRFEIQLNDGSGRRAHRRLHVLRLALAESN